MLVAWAMRKFKQMALAFDIFITKTLFAGFSPSIIGRDTTPLACRWRITNFMAIIGV
jgi:hypothetical protein